MSINRVFIVLCVAIAPALAVNVVDAAEARRKLFDFQLPLHASLSAI